MMKQKPPGFKAANRVIQAHVILLVPARHNHLHPKGRTRTACAKDGAWRRSAGRHPVARNLRKTVV